MKNYLKTSKWLRWTAAGAFGLMLVLNVMISLDFDKDKLLPSLTLVELGNMAFADGGTEVDCRIMNSSDHCWVGDCHVVTKCSTCKDALAFQPYEYGFTCNQCSCE